MPDSLVDNSVDKMVQIYPSIPRGIYWRSLYASAPRLNRDFAEAKVGIDSTADFRRR